MDQAAIHAAETVLDPNELSYRLREKDIDSTNMAENCQAAS